MPEFPGGEEELLKYVNNNIIYPTIARENGITGRVVLTFIVSVDGTISNISVLRDIGGGCAEEAIRVVKKMPKWSAGRHNGRPVNVEFNLPINFELR
jgi:protein TonB